MYITNYIFIFYLKNIKKYKKVDTGGRLKN